MQVTNKLYTCSFICLSFFVSGFSAAVATQTSVPGLLYAYLCEGNAFLVLLIKNFIFILCKTSSKDSVNAVRKKNEQGH